MASGTRPPEAPTGALTLTSRSDLFDWGVAVVLGAAAMLVMAGLLLAGAIEFELVLVRRNVSVALESSRKIS